MALIYRFPASQYIAVYLSSLPTEQTIRIIVLTKKKLVILR